jgi:VWFA-related protein
MSADFAGAQLFSVPSPGDKFDVGLTSLSALQTAKPNSIIFPFNTPYASLLESSTNSVSKLDLKAPGDARREYEKGYLALMRRDLQGAIDHLARATSIYPSFVAAHNALGIAYLNFGQTQEARDEFVRAVELDGHLPGSYLNLGCAQSELQQYSEAEESLRKASAIAPLDLGILTALAYAEFQNRNYPAVIATARYVHSRAHQDAALVHLFAAAAWEAQHHLREAQEEMETLLSEDPKSPLSGQYRQMLDQVKAQQVTRTQVKRLSADPPHSESGDPPSSGSEQPDADVPHQVIRVRVEEVAMYFAATDHGKSVTSLGLSDVQIRDDSQPPEAILGFHNVTQLPLRIGLIIDISGSVTDRFWFEQDAASRFLKVVTDENDLAFVIGSNSCVFLVQDFTADQTLTTRALAQLAPGGGTALWDAVAFAADKLASRPETQPVARVLVVISDGDDNSSSVSLQQAIWTAQRGEVAIYTVSTREGSSESLGNRALKTLSEQTGGATFTPGSLSGLTRSLADLQQVLRGRYLIYYQPASSQPDGRFHAVDIKAEKNGRKLKIFARKGYYASALLDAGI